MQKNVLLIENDAPFARAVASALESRGYGVRTTADGKEGFDLARETHPDCVVLCVELPGLSGYSWCNRLKKDAELKSIPLVITSAEATEETFDQHRKLKTRAEDYLIKPFPAQTLVEHVAALVGESEAPPDDVIVSMDDVELESAPPASTGPDAGPPPVEEDADLRMLDEAFDHISRGGDEPSALTPGGSRSEPPLTLMPDADESPPLSDLDREMAAALASLAEEAAEASKVSPRVEPVAEEETPILLEDVEILPGPDESAEALQGARDEAAALRDEAAALRAEVASLREEGDGLRADADRLREEGERLRLESEQLREEGERLRQEGDRLRQESELFREEAAQAAASRDAELAELRARTAEAESAAGVSAASLAEASRRADRLDGELATSRAEADGFREEIASLRAEAEGSRTEVASLRSELAGLAAQHEERNRQIVQRIQKDEKIREKTRKALAMVLQVLEDRSGGDGGSAPPAAP